MRWAKDRSAVVSLTDEGATLTGELEHKKKNQRSLPQRDAEDRREKRKPMSFCSLVSSAVLCVLCGEDSALCFFSNHSCLRRRFHS